MVVAHDTGIQHARFGAEGIDSRVNTELGDATGQHCGSIQMGKSGCGSWICQIIGGDINGLNGGDGAFLRGRDSFLHQSHVNCEGRLITDGRGDTAEEGRHFGASLGEAENVVDEEKNWDVSQSCL